MWDKVTGPRQNNGITLKRKKRKKKFKTTNIRSIRGLELWAWNWAGSHGFVRLLLRRGLDAATDCLAREILDETFGVW